MYCCDIAKGCMGELYDKNTGWAFQRDIADKCELSSI